MIVHNLLIDFIRHINGSKLHCITLAIKSHGSWITSTTTGFMERLPMDLKRICSIAAVSVVLSIFSSYAISASVQLSGTGFPAPGGTNFSQSGTNAGDVGGITWTLTPTDPSQYDTLYYVVGDYPNGFWNPAGPHIGTSSSSPDLLSYDSGSSNLGSGIVRWTGTTNIGVWNGSIYYPTAYGARFTLSVTDSGGTSQPLIDASTIPGMPISVGGAYQVPGTFKANWLFELYDGSTWVAAKP